VSTLTTAANNSDVILSGGATAEDVFWQVGSSATLGTTTTFAGTIMAQASVSLDTGATLNGRALARTGGSHIAKQSGECTPLSIRHSVGGIRE
jgi:acyl-CoA thioesterase